MPPKIEERKLKQRERLIDNLPPSWRPYAELMRLDRPAGFYAFYIPYIIGTLYAACVSHFPPSIYQLLGLAGKFLVGSIILRGAACTWNDNIDQEFDRKVARCRNRPIARGAVTTAQGHLFTLGQSLAGALLFMWLPGQCLIHSIPIVLLFAFYPFAKRVTHYPQFVLGFPFAWAIPMSCAALDVDPFSSSTLVMATTSLVVANVLWTMIYDTVYAHQDIKDDKKAGVKSMAVKFDQWTKHVLSGFAFIQVSLLAIVGWRAELSAVYFVVSAGGTAISLGAMLIRVDLTVPKSCAWWFHHGFWFVGGSVIAGFLLEYLDRLSSLNK